MKEHADGKCGICGERVPDSNLNLFYCGESCRREAWRINNPDEKEPDWDSIPKVLFY